MRRGHRDWAEAYVALGITIFASSDIDCVDDLAIRRCSEARLAHQRDKQLKQDAGDDKASAVPT